MASKLQFAQQAQGQANLFANFQQVAQGFISTYTDQGYNSGGSNPITDADVASLGIKAVDVGNWITLLKALANMTSNQAVAQGLYQLYIDAMRTDI